MLEAVPKSKAEIYREVLFINAKWLLGWLIWGFALSLLAELLNLTGGLHYLYFVDLFSHFTLQYIIGGFVLGLIFMALKKRKQALISLFIFAACLCEARLPLEYPLIFNAPQGIAVYKVVTFNHNVGKTEFGPLPEWLSSPQNEFDIVVLQEANAATVEVAKKVAKVFPYQILEPRDHPFGMVVLSRSPFLDIKRIPLNGPYMDSFGVYAKIKSPKAKKPLEIYALHPYPPAGILQQAQRDFELMEVSRAIQSQGSGNIVMLGDWNITPFAPEFRKVLSVSGLRYQSYGVLQNPTWPTFTFLNFLRIPIDHILYSRSLLQLDKYSGPDFGSDHLPLVAHYAEK